MKDINIDDFVVPDKKADFAERIDNFKSAIITSIYYALGLFLGSEIYRLCAGKFLENFTKVQQNTLQSLFFSNFLMYFSVFLLVLFLGFCLFGNHIINIIPAAIGITTGIKVSYYFINFSVKGVGYAMIIVIPYAALFVSCLALSIETSSNLSKSLLESAKSQNKILDTKPYFKRYLILGICIIISAALNSIMTYLMANIVTI